MQVWYINFEILCRLGATERSPRPSRTKSVTLTDVITSLA